MDKVSRRDLMLSGAKWIGAAAVAGTVLNNEFRKVFANEGGGIMNKCASNFPKINKSILERIGNTSMLQLRNIVPKDHARILIKLESENPTGSMKDRMALAMIEAAESDGRLKPGGRVVEYTGGSTGVSLSFVCSVKGYPIDIVSSDAFSSEKLNHMAALGAKLTIIKSDRGGMDEALTRNMIAAAKQIQEEKGSFLTDQLKNTDVLPRYRDMGEEIWQQTEGNVDAFVQGVGTGGSLRGIAERLIEHNPDVHIVAVEPSESAVLSGEEQGSHKIEGIGAGFVVALWRPEIVDEIVKVSTEEAQDMARKLAKEEGVFAGTSTGSNLLTAIKMAKELGPNSTVVTLMVDSGMKYLSTALYNGVN